MAQRPITAARTILTGASSGIGRELALELARGGARVIVTARREDRLQELLEAMRKENPQGEFDALPGDITKSALRARLVQEAEQRWGGLDLLINNAGAGALGPFADADEARLRWVMEVNFFAPAELTREALPLLRKGARPMVVNFGSVLGHRAVPQKSEYSAAKFALHGLSDALRTEFHALGIDVLLVSPSTTRTEFFDSAQGENASEARRAAASGVSPQTVARQTIRAIRRGRREIILTFGGKMLVWLDRLCPWLMDRVLMRWAK